MVSVGEDLVLERQEGTARVDEVDAGQVVLLGDFLRAEVLLHSQRKVGAALDRSVVGDDHALLALDHPDPRHDPGRGRLSVVHLPGGQGSELEEGRSRIEEAIDALAGRQLAPRAVALDRFLAATARDQRGALPELGDKGDHVVAPGGEDVRFAFDL